MAICHVHAAVLVSAVDHRPAAATGKPGARWPPTNLACVRCGWRCRGMPFAGWRAHSMHACMHVRTSHSAAALDPSWPCCCAGGAVLVSHEIETSALVDPGVPQLARRPRLLRVALRAQVLRCDWQRRRAIGGIVAASSSTLNGALATGCSTLQPRR
eukprot:361684-Chlamydomonas_euryale.AAC.13